MAGTKAGGLKAAKTNKLRHGANFYVEAGRRGGEKSRGGGFASMTPEKLSEAGRKGGLTKGENYRRNAKMEKQWQNQNSKSSASTTRPQNAKRKARSSARPKGSCRACLQERVIYRDGFCQRDYNNKQLRELVIETEQIDRGEKSNAYETVTIPGYHHDDDKPEYIIDRKPTVWERLFARGKR